jgi:hypothetical protein
MEKMKSIVRIVGVVVNIRRYDFSNGNGKFDLTLNVGDSKVYAEYWYFKNKIAFGDNKITPSAFQNKFIDSEGKSKGERLFGFGEMFINEYTNKKGELKRFTKPRLFKCYPTESEDDYASFETKGIITSYDFDIETKTVKMKLGILSEAWDKNLRKNVPKVKYLDVIDDSGVMLGREEVTIGWEISVRGYIYNTSGQTTDAWGRKSNVNSKYGNYISYLDEANELSEQQMEYEQALNGGEIQPPIEMTKEEPMVVKNEPDDMEVAAEDDFDDEMEDIDF